MPLTLISKGKQINDFNTPSVISRSLLLFFVFFYFYDTIIDFYKMERNDSKLLFIKNCTQGELYPPGFYDNAYSLHLLRFDLFSLALT